MNNNNQVIEVADGARTTLGGGHSGAGSLFQHQATGNGRSSTASKDGTSLTNENHLRCKWANERNEESSSNGQLLKRQQRLLKDEQNNLQLIQQTTRQDFQQLQQRSDLAAERQHLSQRPGLDIHIQQHCLESNNPAYGHLQYTDPNNNGRGSVVGSIAIPSAFYPAASPSCNNRPFLPSMPYYDAHQINKAMDDANQLLYNQNAGLCNGNRSQQEVAQFQNRSSMSSTGSNYDPSSPKCLPDQVVPLSEGELEQISVRELNKLLQGQERSLISKVKAKRRTLKNRGYALKCRSRRVEIQHRLSHENKLLREQMQTMKHQMDAMQSRLHNLLQEKAAAASNHISMAQHVATHQGYYHQPGDPSGLVPINIGPIFTGSVNRCVLPVSSLCLPQSNDLTTGGARKDENDGSKLGGLDPTTISTSGSFWSIDFDPYSSNSKSA